MAGAIDLHHHFFPPEFVHAARDVFERVGPGYSRVLEWTVQDSLAAMDAGNIDKAMLSISIGGWFGDAVRSRELCRMANEYAASLARTHAGRFGWFATIPLPDVAGSLDEIRYSLDVLGADGIYLLSSYDDRWPGDPAGVPVFDELDRRAAVVVVHPSFPSYCRSTVPGIPPAFLEFPFDSTRAIASLLFSGTFSRCPDIRFVFTHGGGTLPMLAARIGLLARVRPDLAARLPNGAHHELARLYLDITSATSPPAYAALRALVPLNQLLFGTDFPYGSITEANADLAALALPSDAANALLRQNAVALFKAPSR